MGPRREDALDEQSLRGAVDFRDHVGRSRFAVDELAHLRLAFGEERPGFLGELGSEGEEIAGEVGVGRPCGQRAGGGGKAPPGVFPNGVRF